MIVYNIWEKNCILDFGVDIVVLNNWFIMLFDWYRRDIIGFIIKGVILFVVLGVNFFDMNNVDICNEGWELIFGWRDQFLLVFKLFNYSVLFNFLDY